MNAKDKTLIKGLIIAGREWNAGDMAYAIIDRVKGNTIDYLIEKRKITEVVDKIRLVNDRLEITQDSCVEKKASDMNYSHRYFKTQKEAEAAFIKMIDKVEKNAKASLERRTGTKNYDEIQIMHVEKARESIEKGIYKF